MIDTIMKPFSGFTMFFIRLASGGVMLVHGWPKLQKLMAGGPIQWADPIGLGPGISLGLAVFAEVVCAILILIGLKSRWASIPLIVTMLVAVFIVHGGDPFKKQELGLMYLAMYVAILFGGSGNLSVDQLFGKKH